MNVSQSIRQIRAFDDLWKVLLELINGENAKLNARYSRGARLCGYPPDPSLTYLA
jgi:hypothetical protein